MAWHRVVVITAAAALAVVTVAVFGFFDARSRILAEG